MLMESLSPISAVAVSGGFAAPREESRRRSLGSLGLFDPLYL